MKESTNLWSIQLYSGHLYISLSLDFACFIYLYLQVIYLSVATLLLLLLLHQLHTDNSTISFFFAAAAADQQSVTYCTIHHLTHSLTHLFMSNSLSLLSLLSLPSHFTSEKSVENNSFSPFFLFQHLFTHSTCRPKWRLSVTHSHSLASHLKFIFFSLSLFLSSLAFTHT